MKFRIKTLHVFLIIVASLWHPLHGEAERREELLGEFPAPEARQGVAVDSDHLYVISNFEIGKYDKTTHARVATWKCPEGDPLIHLNAGIVIDGRLYCAHSNYPEVPMTSSVEVWDAATLEHIESHSFGIGRGSLTWIDRKDGHWYACFAHYGNRAAEPNRDPSWTRLVKFDTQWQELESWVFPPSIIQEFGEYSSSGGTFGPDGRLYITGHDHKKLYVMEFPSAGSVLLHKGHIDIAAEGQAFAFDPSSSWKLYSIVKRERKVIVSQLVRRN